MHALTLIRALLMLALSSCGRPATLTVLPAPDIYETTATVAAAINAVAGASLVVIGDDPGRTVYVYANCGSYGDGEIRVGPCGDLNAASAINLVHELGHAFGLTHVSDPASIMFYRYHPMTLGEAAASLVKELHR